jgi:hypothetical protein
LVFDRAHYSLSLPVNGIYLGHLVVNDLYILVRNSQSQIQSLEFSIGQVSKLVDPHFVGFHGISIMLSYFEHVFEENTLAILFLSFSLVLLLVIVFELLKGIRL